MWAVVGDWAGQAGFASRPVDCLGRESGDWEALKGCGVKNGHKRSPQLVSSQLDWNNLPDSITRRLRPE